MCADSHHSFGPVNTHTKPSKWLMKQALSMDPSLELWGRRLLSSSAVSMLCTTVAEMAVSNNYRSPNWVSRFRLHVVTMMKGFLSWRSINLNGCGYSRRTIYSVAAPCVLCTYTYLYKSRYLWAWDLLRCRRNLIEDGGWNLGGYFIEITKVNHRIISTFLSCDKLLSCWQHYYNFYSFYPYYFHVSYA